MAELLLVGNKGVVSMYETGRRVPTPDTVQAYARVTGCSADDLMKLRAAALKPTPRTVAEDPDGRLEPDLLPNETPDAELEPADPTARTPSRRRRLTAAALGAIAAAGLVVIVMTRPSEPRRETAQLTTPHGQVSEMTTVRGTVTGHEDDDLWLDVQAVDGDRHHPTEEPCPRDGHTFTFGTLYVGQPTSHGVRFRISVIATAKGSQAGRRLLAYGARRKDSKNAYAGLVALPAGATVVSAVEVTRR